MKAHPAIYWAKFYLTRRSHTYDGVAQLLSVSQLGGLNADELRDIDAEMDYPRPFNPHNLRDRESQRFLRKEGVYEAWRNGPDMQKALEILATDKLRQLIETYILSPIRPDQAVRKLKREFPLAKVTVKAYELFQHYFWNRELMTSLQWGKFVEDRRADNDQWTQLALNSSGPGGVQAVLWKTGTGPLRGVETNRAFTDARNIAYMMIMQIAMEPPSRYHSEMLLNYLRAMKMAQEGIDASSDAIRDVVQAFSAFKMRHAEIQTPSVQQLSGGNVSEAEGGEGAEEKIEYD